MEQTFESLYRTDIGKQSQFLTHSQQTLFGTYFGSRIIVEFRIAYSRKQNSIRVFTNFISSFGERIAHFVDSICTADGIFVVYFMSELLTYAFLKMEADKINAIQVSDLNKKNIGTLRAYAKSGKAPGQFIEVMACEGGCITGPSTHSGSNNGKRQLVQELAKQKKTY